MTTGEKIYFLIRECKASVSILINNHRDMHLSIVGYLETFGIGDQMDNVTNELIDNMIERDQIIQVTIYPHTPIGSYNIFHYDLDLALDECIKILEQKS